MTTKELNEYQRAVAWGISHGLVRAGAELPARRSPGEAQAVILAQRGKFTTMDCAGMTKEHAAMTISRLKGEGCVRACGQRYGQGTRFTVYQVTAAGRARGKAQAAARELAALN